MSDQPEAICQLAAEQLVLERQHKRFFEIAKLSYGGRGSLCDAITLLCEASIESYMSAGGGSGPVDASIALAPHVLTMMLYDQILREYTKSPWLAAVRNIERTIAATIDAHRDATRYAVQEGLGVGCDPNRYLGPHGALLQLAGAMFSSDRLLFSLESAAASKNQRKRGSK